VGRFDPATALTASMVLDVYELLREPIDR